jgi:hypothetical protein
MANDDDKQKHRPKRRHGLITLGIFLVIWGFSPGGDVPSGQSVAPLLILSATLVVGGVVLIILGWMGLPRKGITGNGTGGGATKNESGNGDG